MGVSGQPEYCEGRVINICCLTVKHDSWCPLPACPVLPAIMVEVITRTEGLLNNAECDGWMMGWWCLGCYTFTNRCRHEFFNYTERRITYLNVQNVYILTSFWLQIHRMWTKKPQVMLTVSASFGVSDIPINHERICWRKHCLKNLAGASQLREWKWILCEGFVSVDLLIAINYFNYVAFWGVKTATEKGFVLRKIRAVQKCITFNFITFVYYF